MIIDKPLVVTNHCKDRMREFGLSPYKILFILPRSTPEKPPKDEGKKYKNNEGVTWWRDGTLIFTVAEREDKRRQGQRIYLLLSIFNQEMYLPNYVLNREQGLWWNDWSVSYSVTDGMSHPTLDMLCVAVVVRLILTINPKKGKENYDARDWWERTRQENRHTNLCRHAVVICTVTIGAVPGSEPW